MTPEAVAAASSRWSWYPTDAETLDHDRFLLVRWPDYFAVPPAIIRFAADAPVRESLEAAIAQAREWGASELVVWVKLDAPPALEAHVQTRGGVLDETVDVFALDPSLRPDLAVPDEFEVRWQLDVETTRAAIEVGMAAFDEGTMPDDERLRELAIEAAADFHAGRTGCALAYDGARAVASGGVTLADGVARLWGGGVVPEARGRGAYRAVLDARLRLAVDRGATMALVKGRVQTSGPILRRAGFEVFGQERSYVLAL